MGPLNRWVGELRKTYQMVMLEWLHCARFAAYAAIGLHTIFRLETALSAKAHGEGLGVARWRQ
jgi:hypothetical protein